MSWALERRALILTIIGLVVLTVVAFVAIATFYKAPTCADGVQNQDEEGIDCGGSCAYLCSALVEHPTPTVLFARALALSNGRTDVLAYVENKNQNSAINDARYTIELYSEDRALLATRDGVMDIPAGAEVPVYVPFLFSGTQKVGQAFLSFDDASLVWFSAPSYEPTVAVEDIGIANTQTAPRITATVVNKTALPTAKIVFVASVYDARGNVIAASQTVTLSIPAFSSTPAVFTWNAPFAETPARIEVDPVPVL